MSAQKSRTGSRYEALPEHAGACEEAVVALGWQDLCGITRVRGLPLKDLESKAETGLGFPAAGQALTVGGGIAPNRWGPVEDVRQVPALETLVQVPRIANYPGLNLVLSDSMDTQGQPFPCCTRTLFKDALRKLSETAGLEFAASFEHEFTLSGPDFQPQLCMTLDAWRALGSLPGLLVAALGHAGVRTEAFEPEFGQGQYELSVSHEWGVKAADKAVMTREIIRDVARHAGLKASFSPKVAPNAVGNGAHIHFSLRDRNGAPVLFDAGQPKQLAAIGGSFAAGVIRHIAYLGSESIYDVALDNGRTVRALRSNLTRRDQEDLAWDEPVWLAWHACTPAVLLS